MSSAITKQEEIVEVPTLQLTVDNWREQIERTKTMLKEKQFDTAAATLSQLLEFLTKNSNLASPLEMSRCYMQYGKSLLRLSQSNSEEQPNEEEAEFEEEGEDEEEEEESENKEEAENDKNDKDNVNDVASEEQKAEKSNVPEDGVVETLLEDINQSNNENGNIDEREEGEEEEQKIEQNSAEIALMNEVIDQEALCQMLQSSGNNGEDREVAWEALETARVRCEEWLKNNTNTKVGSEEASERLQLKEVEEMKVMIVEIHSLLGELQMDNSNFKESIDEFEKAIEKYNLFHLNNVRDLAYFHFMCVLCAEMGMQPLQYQTHLKTTLNLLTQQLQLVLTDLGTCPKQDNIEKTLELAKDALANEQLKEKIGQNKFDEIVEFKGILDELLSKDQELVKKKMEEEEGEVNREEVVVNESEKENDKPREELKETTHGGISNNESDLIKSNGRKRSLLQAEIRDDTGDEPKSKKLRSE